MGLGPALAIGGASVVGSIMGGNAAADGARAGARVQKQMYDQTREDYMPWVEAGERGLGMYEDFMQGYSPDKFSFEFSQDDPSYQWRLNQGLEATERASAARGNLVSGNRLMALNEYAQGMASTEFQNEFNRALSTYETNQSTDINYMNALRNYAGMGLDAIGGTVQAGVPLAQGASRSLADAGMGQAAGITGAFRGVGNAISDYAYGRGYNGGYSVAGLDRGGNLWGRSADGSEFGYMS